jgi:hypothetical protein
MGTAHYTSLQMYPDNLEECLEFVVKCANNFKQHAQNVGHPVTFENAVVIAIAQLQEDTANKRCREELA